MKQPRFERMRQLVSALALCLIAAPALAGIADSPLPELVAGKKTYHVYSVPGIIPGGVGLASFFLCTSTDTATMQVSVELFPAPGGAPANDAVADSYPLGPGATVVFGTRNAAGISVYKLLGFGLGSSGSARILATSKKITCTAFLADEINAPPTSMVYLTIIKKTTQKGE